MAGSIYMPTAWRRRQSLRRSAGGVLNRHQAAHFGYEIELAKEILKACWRWREIAGEPAYQ